MHERLVKASRRLTRNPDDAHDLLGDTVVRLLEKGHQFTARNGASFDTYAHRVMRTMNLNQHRSEGRHPAEGFPEGFEAAVQPAQVRAVEAAELHSHLGQLAGDRRQVLELAMQGYVRREIAEQAEIDPGTAASRYARGLDDLAQLYGLPRARGAKRTRDVE